MLRRTLLALAVLSLCACPPSEPAPDPTPAATPAPTPQPTPEPVVETPAPEETPEPGSETPPEDDGMADPRVVGGEPFVVEANPIQPGLTEGFTFWGWSADGQRFAFETYNPGEGAVECDMRYGLFVVDAETDKYVDGGKITVRHESPEPGPSGVCAPKDLTPGIEAARQAAFDTHGIVVGNLLPPVAIKGSGKSRTVALEGKKNPLEIAFRVLGGTDDAYSLEAKAGAAYYLALKVSGGNQIVEPGRYKRSYVIDYEPKWVFPSTDGKHAAFIVGRTHAAFEGTRDSWMSNGVLLPDYL